jgi:hypothetical protein
MRRTRGQGTVELAIGTMIVVTVMIFGIHFAEILFISLKVQEAAVSAQWDATGKKVHSLPGDFSMAAPAVDQAGRDAQARYVDFDGRTSVSRLPTFGQVFTNASNMRVTCALVPSANPFPAALPARLAQVYQDPGQVQCAADADIRAMRIPTDFLDAADGFFKEKHLHRTSYHACGFGAAFGATCAQAPRIILDDWGFAGPDETSECKLLEGCDNLAYYNSVQDVFLAGGAAKGDAAQQLAAAVVGRVPIDPNHFWMSFRGEEDDFTECVPMGDGPNQWPTSPGDGSPVDEYNQSYWMRSECALGLPCP